MKKLAIITAMVLLVTGFVFGQTFPPAAPSNASDSVEVKAALVGYLTLSDMTELTKFTLNTAGETKQIATAKAATNLKYWTLKVTALSPINNGADSALVATAGTDTYRIPYTFTLVGGTTIGTAFDAQAIPFAGLTKSYSTRITGGSTGETITMSITYGAEDTANWYAGLVYTDTITVTLIAN
ncbi:MAG: hypothetical protein WHT81_04545 [Rectinemataceae bacterium]|nr:hypothetical protein [Spirochaetaceae bacterium]